jgi:hypothetical protein
MANQLEITSRYVNTAWVITSAVKEGSDPDFPTDIFLWTLDEAGALSAFQAIGHVDQVAKYPLYDSNRTSNFGIHLVRADHSEQRVSSEEDRDKVIIVLKSAFKRLLEGYVTSTLPIVEVYP